MDARGQESVQLTMPAAPVAPRVLVTVLFALHPSVNWGFDSVILALATAHGREITYEAPVQFRWITQVEQVNKETQYVALAVEENMPPRFVLSGGTTTHSVVHA